MITRSTAEVEFHGGRARTAPLAWGQQSSWDTKREWELAGKTFFVLTRWQPIPLLLSLGDVQQQLAELLLRHESLRTLYHPTANGDATQEVLGTGSLTIEVFDRPAEDPVEFTALVTDCLVRYEEMGFDHDKELPIRFSVLMHEGIPVLLVLGVSHMSADFISADIVAADIATLLQARADGKPIPAARPALQPADLAAFENSPAGQLLNIEAMRYLRRQVERSLPGMLPARAAPASPRFLRGELESEAIPVALRAAARRYRTTTSVLLLSITTALVRCCCPGPVCPVDIMQNNRATPDLFGTVSSLNQAVATTVDLTAADFGAVVAHCAAAMASARRHGRYSGRAAQEALRAAADAEPGCQFNDMWSTLPQPPAKQPPTGAELERLAEATTFTWPQESEAEGKVLFVDTRGTPDRIHLSLFADTALLSPDEIRGFLHAFERTTMTLALADMSLAQIARQFDEHRPTGPP